MNSPDIKDVFKGLEDIVSAFNNTREKLSLMLDIGSDIKMMIGDYLPENDVINTDLKLEGSVDDEAFSSSLKRIVRNRSHVDSMLTLKQAIGYHISAIGAIDSQLMKLKERIKRDSGPEQEAARKLYGIRENQRTILSHRLERLAISLLDFRKDCIDKVAKISNDVMAECIDFVELKKIMKKRTCEDSLVKMEELEYEFTNTNK